MQYLDQALRRWADGLGISWGWAEDPAQEFHNQVLYVELPEFGQCSFHTRAAESGKAFPGQWDRKHRSQEVILSHCDGVYDTVGDQHRADGTTLIPFDNHAGEPIDELEPAYLQWRASWEGADSWPSVKRQLKEAAAAVAAPA